MAFAPIALTIPQYEDYANNWLKAYNQGTTTPLSMATDSTGGTLLVKSEIDAQGFPITAGSARFIPFINGDYDLWLFPTEAEADANDTTNAIQFADNLNADPQNSITFTENGYTVSNKTAAILLTPVSGKTLFVESSDGGLFKAVTGAAPGTYSDDDTAYCGTVFIPTGGDGSIAWVRDFSGDIDFRWFGVVGGGVIDDYSTVQACITYCIANNVTMYAPAGVYALESGLVATLASNSIEGFSMVGDGRALTRFIYSGSGAMTQMLEIVPTGSFGLNVNLKGFELDLTGAPTTSNGLKWNDGAWRSHCDDLYIHRDFITNTGIGIDMGTSNPAGIGVFDTKWTNMYIAAFDINFNAIGTDHSGNTITNLTIADSYISSGSTNVHIEFYNGVFISGSQIEAHSTYGFNSIDGDTAVIHGGSIESPAAGAIGINIDSASKSVIANCDFFNNFGGHFVIDAANTNQGFMYKTSASGFLYPNSKIQLGTSGAGESQIEFIRSGTDLGSLAPAASGIALAVRDAAGIEIFKLDNQNGIVDLLKANGRIRLTDETQYIEFFNATRSVIDIMGTGTPEGVVNGNIGSTFRRRDGAAGTSFYVKEAGTGNTGWVAK